MMLSLTRFVRRSRLATFALLVVCASMFLPGLGTALVTRQQELRVLLAARTMAEGGSWLIPQFMGEERLRKPPLMYWLVASSFRAAGSTQNIVAARLVSATAATALVLATFLLGRRLLGRQTALLAAFVLATSMGFVRHARLAETDLAQTACCSIAIFLLYRVLSQRTARYFLWPIIGLTAGIGFLIKGPASIAMPLAAVVTFLGVEALRSRRRQARPRTADEASRWLAPLLAMLIFAAVALPWYIAVMLQTAASSAQAGDEVSRLLVESRHPGPFVYYCYTLPARMGLWALLLPVALGTAARRWWPHRGPRFVLCWFASSFLVLSLLRSKQEHYALLLFVPAALLCGWLLRQAFRRAPAFLPRFARGYLAALCLVPPVAAVLALGSRLLPASGSWVPLRDAALPALLVCAALGWAGWWYRRRPLASLGAIMAVFAVLIAVQTLRLERFQTGYSAVPGLCASQRAALLAAPKLLVAGPREPVISWYAGRDVQVVTTNVLPAWRTAPAGTVLIASDRDGRPAMAAQVPAPPLASARQLDVAITLFLKSDGAL